MECLSFDFIPLPDRTVKPRNEGLTMAIDRGISGNILHQTIRDYGEYIDVLKIGWGTSRLMRKYSLISKINMCEESGVSAMPGGTLLEIASAHGKEMEFLEAARMYGFSHIEVSCGTFCLDGRKKEIIRCAKDMDFTVFSEVGRKAESWEANLRELADEARCDLDSGASKVILEGRESGTCGIYTKDGSVKLDIVDAISNEIPLPKLIFEAPQKKQQVFFISRYGNDVNLGNIAMDDVLSLETLRLGLRGDTTLQFHREVGHAVAAGN